MSSNAFRSTSRFGACVFTVCLAFAATSAMGSLSAQSPTDTPAGVVAELYDIVTFDAGTTPDWDRARALFLDEAVVVLRTSREGSTTFSVEGWIADFVKFIEDRNVVETGFIEKIVRTHSVVFGDIANIWVLYEPRFPDAEPSGRHGVDNFSLVKKDGSWLIASITNEIVTPDRPAPDVLLGEPLHEGHAAADSEAIIETALDYIDGYYTGDAARMENALHPELAKRIVMTRPGQESMLQDMTAEQLIQATAGGGGKGLPPERKQSDVTIMDIYQNAASVKVVAGDWIDYLHLALWNGEWKIVNVLWELKPQG